MGREQVVRVSLRLTEESSSDSIMGGRSERLVLLVAMDQTLVWPVGHHSLAVTSPTMACSGTRRQLCPSLPSGRELYPAVAVHLGSFHHVSIFSETRADVRQGL